MTAGTDRAAGAVRNAGKETLRCLKRVKRRRTGAAQLELCETPENRRYADEKGEAKQLPETAGHCALSMENRNSAAFVCGDGEVQKLWQQPDPGYLK